jgi:hypothetical protein
MLPVQTWEAGVRQRFRWVLAVAFAALASACASSADPNDRNLRDSFAEQIASVGFVKNFERRGDELTFRAPYEDKAEVSWRVRIDSAKVEPNDDQAQPFKGTVKSSWYADEKLIEPGDSFTGLPSDFVTKGLAQDCWAFWVAATRQWSWT